MKATCHSGLGNCLVVGDGFCFQRRAPKQCGEPRHFSRNSSKVSLRREIHHPQDYRSPSQHAPFTAGAGSLEP
jgi:hypothetical protein